MVVDVNPAKMHMQNVLVGIEQGQRGMKREKRQTRGISIRPLALLKSAWERHMCLSPEEMSADQLQALVDKMKRYLNRPEDQTSPYYRNMYEGRLERFEVLLKEKAEKGEMV
jgi:hypothetical protein